MADITLPTTFADAAVLTPGQVNNNIYSPAATPVSFEVINGWLDNANRDNGTYNISRYHIRPRSMVGGRQVGNTAIIDFFDEVFPVDQNEPSAHIPVHGAAIQFFLPYSPTVVVLMWQVYSANDADYNVGTDPSEFRLFIDSTLQTGQMRTQPGGRIPAGTTRLKRRDRVWSGHYVRMNSTDTSVLAAGWHSADIRAWSGANTLRIRIRNFKYWYTK